MVVAVTLLFSSAFFPRQPCMQSQVNLIKIQPQTRVAKGKLLKLTGFRFKSSYK